MIENIILEETNLNVQLVDREGKDVGIRMKLKSSIHTSSLSKKINEITKNEDMCSYAFFITNNVENESEEYTLGVPIISTLHNAILSNKSLIELLEQNIEATIRIVYHPQSAFKVKPIQRCTASMQSHKDQVLCLSFNADGKSLASGSADGAVKFWDLEMQSPQGIELDMKHPQFIMIVTWSPNGKMLASSCYAGYIYTWTLNENTKKWEARNGALQRKNIKTKKKVKALEWQPLHLDGRCRYLAAAYENCSVTVWDVVLRLPHFNLSAYEKPVRAMKWTGENNLLCACEDGFVYLWEISTQQLKQKLRVHNHWINCISLNTDYALKTGAFDPMNRHKESMREISLKSPEVLQNESLEIYKRYSNNTEERVAFCSDDKTLSLYKLTSNGLEAINSKMNGHQAVILYVKFSPDGLLIASAGMDKNIKIWDGRTGEYIDTLYGHINWVLGLSWSPDSRQLVSCSKDSTVLCWSMEQIRGLKCPIDQMPEDPKLKKKNTAKNCKRVRISHLLSSLPGHRDQVNGVEFSPDGITVASAGKDSIVKLWRN